MITAGKTTSLLYTAVEKEKVSIRDIMNYSAAFLNGSNCMICIIQDLETGTAIPKQMWTQHSCT